MGTRDEFVDRFAQMILDLPQDVKAVFDLVDDAEIVDEGRVAACGALVSLLQPGDLIPDSLGPVALVDDVVTMRLAAEFAVPEGHPRRAAHAEKHPEFYGALSDDIALAKEAFGDAFVLLEQRLRRLGTLEHKGRRASKIAGDDRASTWLFEEVDEALTEMEMDEDSLGASLRKFDQAVAQMRRRLVRR